MFDQADSDDYIPASPAASDCGRYSMIWAPAGNPNGAMYGPANWQNCEVGAGWYIPLPTDANTGSFGKLGHTLDYYRINHQNYVLMSCYAQTNNPVYVDAGPTSSPVPAYITSASTAYVPLDIHNASAIAALIEPSMKKAMDPSLGNGWGIVAMDEAVFWFSGGVDPGHNDDASDTYPCGIFTNWANHSSFVRRYTGYNDTADWTNDVIAYLKALRPLRLADGIALWVNHPMDADPANANQVALMQNVDDILWEYGFAGIANQTNDALALDAINYMRTAQETYNEFVDIDDNYNIGGETWVPLTAQQKDFAMASFWMGAEWGTQDVYQTASLWASNHDGFGTEDPYLAQYQDGIGATCAEMTPSSGAGPFSRKFQFSIAITDLGSSVNQTVSIENLTGYPYTDFTDMFGRTVNSDTVTLNEPTDGYVLLLKSGLSLC